VFNEAVSQVPRLLERLQHTDPLGRTPYIADGLIQKHYYDLFSPGARAALSGWQYGGFSRHNEISGVVTYRLQFIYGDKMVTQEVGFTVEIGPNNTSVITGIMLGGPETGESYV